MKERIAEKFKTLFGEEGDFFTSAGRINLIGEHTDYNGGFVFPGAVDKGIIAEIRLNGTDKVCAYALDLDEYCEFGLNEEDLPNQSWARYIFGVCRETIKRGGKIAGFNTVFAGDVPLGAGMSSSAALESTFAFALNYLFSLGIDKFELAKIGQATEHNYCGVNCGIMDQFAVGMGRSGFAIALDCATLDYELVPLHIDGYKLVIANSNKHHDLVTSEYNTRRAQCEKALEILRQRYPVDALCALTPEQLEKAADLFSDEVLYRRARHAVTENARVNEAIQALRTGDLSRFGRLMNESHHSLKEDYEVTGVEMDVLAEEAQGLDGVLGSRITGGGFGGCTVSLVREDAVDAFVRRLGEIYTGKVGLRAEFYVADIGDGARKIC